MKVVNFFNKVGMYVIITVIALLIALPIRMGQLLKSLSKKLRFSDYLVAGSVIFFFIAHLTTQYIAGVYHDTAQSASQAAQIFKMNEANPIAAFILPLRGLNVIYTYVIMPSLVFSVYWVIRKYNMARYPFLVDQVAIFMFSVAMIDATNDLAYLAGLIA